METFEETVILNKVRNHSIKYDNELSQSIGMKYKVKQSQEQRLYKQAYETINIEKKIQEQNFQYKITCVKSLKFN